MAKKLKKKNKIKIIPVFIFLLIIAGISFSVYFLLDMKTKNIFIYNNHILTDQVIIEQAQLSNYPSFLKVSSNKIIQKLNQNKMIKSVKVKKTFLSVINIYVEEYTPLFIRESDNKIVIDDNVLIDNNVDFNLGIPLLVNYVPDTVYSKFTSEMKKVEATIKKEISEIEYTPNDYDKGRFLFYMNDGNLVYVTTTKLNVINQYTDIYPSLEGKKGILYLDSGNHFEILS